ncbi:MAG: HAMP domain-containing histidine kinase [Spirochaetales bacterium]|nr:HAMP domain-containing histidine kinase [Spirochaetales bacterium]
MKWMKIRLYLVYVLFILIYIGVTALILSVLTGESARSRLLLEFETERTASSFMETLMPGLMSEEIELPEKVIGFGIYQITGEKIRTWGGAPDFLGSKFQLLTEPYFAIDNKKKTFTLIRRIGFRHMQSGPPHTMSRPDRMKQRQNRLTPHLLFFELEASQFIQRSHNRWFLGVFISFFLLGVMIVIILLYRKNREYRKKLISKEQLARLGEIARVLAHEIKNPLGAMRIQTGYLKKVLPRERAPDLSILEEEIDRLSLLTNRISDFVRDPLGAPETISLAPFIRNLIKRFNALVDFTQILTNDTISFDRERLRSVLENIINNAIENQQKPDIPIELKLYEDKKNIILTVYDRGPGISQDKMDKVFDPFFTTRAKGSGIGLSITKRFMEAHKGKITLNSRVGGGTEVRLFFRKINEET